MEKNNKMRFSDIIKKVILEQGRYEILRDRFTKPKKKEDKTIPPVLSVERFNEIVKADPTTRRDGDDIKKAGTYVQWLLKQYNRLSTAAQEQAEFGTPEFRRDLIQAQLLFFENLYKTTEDLQKFERFKRQIDQSERDINKHTIDSLFDLVKDFSLEKEKGTKEDRKEAAKTFEYPGSDLIYDGPNWAVTKVTDTGKAGKDAACFLGGFNKETRWCTSAPGLSWFENYIKDGPLYQVFKKGGEVAEETGLPAERYQFHFGRDHFMDVKDRSIDLVDFLNNSAPELKELFKSEFSAGLKSFDESKVSIDYPGDKSSKYIALYGFDELFDSLPKNMSSFDFTQSNRGYGNVTSNIALEIPSEISNYKNLMAIHFEGILKSLPKSIGELSKLQFLSVPNNPNLTTLPVEIANLPNLRVINVGNNPNLVLPEEIENLSEKGVMFVK